MSSEVADSGVREKKSKKDKKDKKERKRPNDGDTEERIAKKLKSLAVTEDGAPVEEKKKKKKKHKEKNGDTIANTEAANEGNSGVPNGIEESRSKKKSKKEKRRKHQQDADDTGAVLAPPAPANAEAQPIPASPPPQTITPVDILQPSDAPEKPKFPLFSRKIKEYVPIFPVGFGNALEFAKSHHLGRRLNNFVPDFGGVMLSYKNAALSEYRDELSEGPLLGANIGEYGASFVWLHMDVGLFMPRRNAWMEGRVNLQDHEHIGIVCWKKFNAFVEAKRLPSGWKWVDETSDQMDVEGNEDEGEEAEQHQEQQHGGHWVDEKGEPIQGRLIRFRIKNYDASASEDQSFLSIEGTMLAEEDEKKLVAEEEQQFARRGGHSLADWGMTRMGKKEEDER